MQDEIRSAVDLRSKRQISSLTSAQFAGIRGTNSRAGLILALALALGACQTLETSERDGRADEARAMAALEKATTCQPEAASRELRIREGVWLGDGAGQENRGDPLPPSFLQPNALQIRSGDELGFSQIMAEISAALGWRVYLAADDIRSSGPGAQNIAGAPNLPGALPGQIMPQGQMRLDMRGNVPDMLDLLARRFNVAWDIDAREKSIRFLRNQMRTFQLAALPADIVVRNAIDPTGSTQQASSGGSAQVTSNPQPGRQQVTTNIDQSKVWQQVEDGIKTILGAQGEVSLSPSTGLVIVRATPDRMREAAAYIRLQNETRLRAVTVRVLVLNIRLADSDEYTLRLQPAFADRGLTLTGASPASVATTTGISQITGSLISNPPASEEFRRFAGSRAILQALSSMGRVSVRNEVSVFTLNDQPTPLLVGSQTSYLASVTQSAVSTAGVQTSLVPGIVTSGTSLNVLPRIRGDGRLVLNYALSISELRRLNNVSSGGQTIQVPEVDTRAVQQSVEMASCETLLLTGFQQEQSRNSKEGVGFPEFMGLGGARVGSKNRDILAILITPEVRGTSQAGTPRVANEGNPFRR